MSDAAVKMMAAALRHLCRARSFGATAIVEQACREGCTDDLRAWERELPGDIAFLEAIASGSENSQTGPAK